MNLFGYLILDINGRKSFPDKIKPSKLKGKLGKPGGNVVLWYSEFFRVQLFLVGGPALIGEKYDTVVRIDDDDIRHVTNIKNIDYCKAKNLNIPGSL